MILKENHYSFKISLEPFLAYNSMCSRHWETSNIFFLRFQKHLRKRKYKKGRELLVYNPFQVKNCNVLYNLLL